MDFHDGLKLPAVFKNLNHVATRQRRRVTSSGGGGAGNGAGSDEHDAEEEEEFRAAFRRAMRLAPHQEDQMSEARHADWFFARQYPFLYARKFRHYFARHLLGGAVWAYGRFGLHIFLIVGVAVCIVGGFRSVHRCSDMNGSGGGAFTFISWPVICDPYVLATTGHCEYGG